MGLLSGAGHFISLACGCLRWCNFWLLPRLLFSFLMNDSVHALFQKKKITAYLCWYLFMYIQDPQDISGEKSLRRAFNFLHLRWSVRIPSCVLECKHFQLIYFLPSSRKKGWSVRIHSGLPGLNFQAGHHTSPVVGLGQASWLWINVVSKNRPVIPSSVDKFIWTGRIGSRSSSDWSKLCLLVLHDFE
jgi:hypothetical protein